MVVFRSTILAGFLLATVPAPAGLVDLVALPSEPGRWSIRAELMYDEVSKSLVRREIRVWDLHPSRNLVFTWAPDPPRAAAAGAAAGVGRLTWRPVGAPSYDQASIIIDYQGRLVDGRPGGTGTERDADGLSYEGEWRAGVPDGRGRLRFANGADYDGSFRNGRAEGRGVFIDVDGETYDGVFRAGLREGEATTTLPNHLTYRSSWHMGEEMASSRRLRLAQLGGASVAADQDIRIGITVDGHPANDGMLGYANVGSGETLKIVPDDKFLMAVWKGNGDLAKNAEAETGTFGMPPAALMPLSLTLNVRNRGSVKTQVAGAFIRVDSSEVDRQPAVEIRGLSDLECGTNAEFGNYAPAFRIENRGWGQITNAKIQFEFFDQDHPFNTNYTRAINFSMTGKKENITFERFLKDSGVKTTLLREYGRRGIRLMCRNSEALACLSESQASGIFGSLGSYLSIHYGYIVELGVKGTLSYDWVDDSGVTRHRTSPFTTGLPMATLPQAPECGEGGEPVPVAIKPIELRLHASDYRLPISFQGLIPPGQTARYSFSLSAAQSSVHRLSIVLVLADGQQIVSRPIDLTYFVPNR